MKNSTYLLRTGLICKVFALITFISFFSLKSSAQCPVTAYASPSIVVCGNTVNLTAVAEGCKPLNNNFNGGDMTMGGTQPWQSTVGATVQNGTGTHACVGPPAEGAYSVWMGTTVAAPRAITTNAYDMTICAATSATICFDMKYGTQANSSPCEGIDLPAEGVSIQYNSGGGWVTLQYWDPNGGYDPALTGWNRYCISLPPAAMTTATQFRWYQSESSGAGFDAWGLDNMVLNLNTPGYTFDWAHDAQVAAASPTTPPVTPTSNTTYTVTYTNGVETCSSSVDVEVIKPTVTATATPSSICPGQSVQLEAESSIKMNPPTSCGVNSDAICEPFSTVADEQQVGAGATTHSYNNGSVDVLGDFGDAYMTTQILFRASELTAAGIVAGKINSLSLDIQRIETSGGGTMGSVIYPNVKLAIGCTNLTALTASYVGGLTQVYSGTNVNISTGWQPFFFSNSYNWDGVSNIIVQVCFYWVNGASSQDSPPNATNNFYAFLRYNSPGYNCSCQIDASNFSDGVCSTDATFASVFNYRPNVKFGFCKPSTAVLTNSWTSSPAGFTSALYNPTHSPASNTTYTVATNQAGMPAGCAATANVSVTVRTPPTVSISPSPVEICKPTETYEMLNAVASTPSSTCVPQVFTSSPAAAIPNGNAGCTNTAGQTFILNIGGVCTNDLSTNPLQEMTLNITGANMLPNDFEVYLDPPGGANGEILLVNKRGGNTAGSSYSFTLRNAGGTNVNTDNAGGLSGIYRPEALFPVSGPVMGEWKLRIVDKCCKSTLGTCDAALQSIGTLASWSLKFNVPNDIVSYSWTPTTNLSVPGGPSTRITNTTDGTYNYTCTVTDAAGCTGQASVAVTVTSACTLPIELTDFDLKCENDEIDLNWNVASQQINDFFTIEKSFDGAKYIEIGTVDGDGNSSTMTSYSFKDKNEFKHESAVYPVYYRLSQTDFNGEKTIIATRALDECRSTNSACINLYPNPVDDYRVVVSTSGIQNKMFELLVHDMLGKLVYSKTIVPESDDYNVSIQLPESLQRGIYLVSSKGSHDIHFCEQKIAIQ